MPPGNENCLKNSCSPIASSLEEQRAKKPKAYFAHEYLAPYHDPTDEPVADEKFDWSFNDADLPVDTWKIMM